MQQSADELLRLGSILQKRDQAQLSPLMESGETSRFLASTRMIEGSIRQASGNIDFEDLCNALRGVNSALQNYGRHPSRGAIREDDNSLRGLANLARSAAEELNNMKKTLNQSTEKTAVEAASVAATLSKQMEGIWLYTARRLQALSQYGSR